jgi:hypothetical protein
MKLYLALRLLLPTDVERAELREWFAAARMSLVTVRGAPRRGRRPAAIAKSGSAGRFGMACRFEISL